MKRCSLVLAAAAAAAAALAGGCGADDGEVTGPFTGPVRRFVVDEVRLPASEPEAQAMGGDLDGDKARDNQLGAVIAALGMQGDVSPYGAEMIRAGVIASVAELQADDLDDDDSAAVWYLGADGAPARPAGGRLVDGVFHSNRTATAERPGEALARLPVFLDADPSDVTLHGLELELQPDGAGGYVAAVHGAVTLADATRAVQRGLAQMIAANPSSHLALARLFDTDDDGAISPAEIAGSQLIQGLLAPDIALRGFEDELLSIGFGAHLAPCAEGRCIAAPPADPCHDRIADGDESDVDCGGSCPLSCAAPLACRAPADCQSGACAAAGTCAAPSCTDGRRDGFESDVDCGGNCGRCAKGARCYDGGDCDTLYCAGGVCASAPP
jgi:hypothetical protein